MLSKLLRRTSWQAPLRAFSPLLPVIIPYLLFGTVALVRESCFGGSWGVADPFNAAGLLAAIFALFGAGVTLITCHQPFKGRWALFGKIPLWVSASFFLPFLSVSAFLIVIDVADWDEITNKTKLELWTGLVQSISMPVTLAGLASLSGGIVCRWVQAIHTKDG